MAAAALAPMLFAAVALVVLAPFAKATDQASCQNIFGAQSLLTANPEPRLTRAQARAALERGLGLHIFGKAFRGGLPPPAQNKSALEMALQELDPDQVFISGAVRDRLSSLAQAEATEPALARELALVDGGDGPLALLLPALQASLDDGWALLEDADGGLRAEVLYRAATMASLGGEAKYDGPVPSNRAAQSDRLLDLLAQEARRLSDLGFAEHDFFPFLVGARRSQIEALRAKATPDGLATIILKSQMSALDPHSAFLGQNEARERLQARRSQQADGAKIGVRLRETSQGAVEISEARPDGPAGRAGLRAGDRLVKIDGQFVFNGSLSALAPLMRGLAGATVELRVRRGSLEMDFVVARELAPEPAASSRIFSIPAETGDVDLAVVRLSRFSRGTAFALGDIVAGLPSVAGMVLDLSGNGGGDRREALLALNSLVPGRAPLVAAPSPSPGGQKAGDNAVFGGLVVVLVDSGTASEAEAVAGSLQARGRAIVVGARTFGKGTTQALEPLPGDLGSILATTAYFYLPNGQSPQGFGIHPDVSLAAAKSAGPRESDHPRALLPSAIAPAIPTPYPLLPGRKALLAELRRLEAAREAEATAGRPPAAIEGTGDDTAVAGALRILADWVASASRAPAPASKEWLP